MSKISMEDILQERGHEVDLNIQNNQGGLSSLKKRLGKMEK